MVDWAEPVLQLTLTVAVGEALVGGEVPGIDLAGTVASEVVCLDVRHRRGAWHTDGKCGCSRGVPLVGDHHVARAVDHAKTASRCGAGRTGAGARDRGHRCGNRVHRERGTGGAVDRAVRGGQGVGPRRVRAPGSRTPPGRWCRSSRLWSNPRWVPVSARVRRHVTVAPLTGLPFGSSTSTVGGPTMATPAVDVVGWVIHTTWLAAPRTWTVVLIEAVLPTLSVPVKVYR